MIHTRYNPYCPLFKDSDDFIGEEVDCPECIECLDYIKTIEEEDV